MTSKRHHYVPRFHLESFVKQAGSLWVYDKMRDGKSRQQSTTDTAVRKHFYSLRRQGRQTDALERALARIEDMAAPILARWKTSSTTPTLEERSKISIFLAVLHGRVPRAVESMKEAALIVFMNDLRTIASDPVRIQDKWQAYLESLQGKPPTLNFEELKAYLQDPELPSRATVTKSSL